LLGEAESRTTLPDDVMATLAELDEKLVALERGVAAESSSHPSMRSETGDPLAIGNPGAEWSDQVGAARMGGEDQDAKVEVLQGARGETVSGGRVLSRRPDAGRADASSISESVARPTQEEMRMAVGRRSEPEARREGSLQGGRLVTEVTAEDLADWRERLRRLIAELTSLRDAMDGAAACTPFASGSAISVPGPFSDAVVDGSAEPAGPSRVSTADLGMHPDQPSDAYRGPVSPRGTGWPIPLPHDRLFGGRVLVDAGPFVDIDAVTVFRHALEMVSGARSADVIALELDRAHVQLELTDPVALGREIRAVFPFNFAIFSAGDGRLSIDLDLSAPQRASADR
jgi:hypothetical protein